VALSADAAVAQPPAWVCHQCSWQHPLPRVASLTHRPMPRCTACGQPVPPEDLSRSIWLETATFGVRQLVHATCWVHRHAPAAADHAS